MSRGSRSYIQEWRPRGRGHGSHRWIQGRGTIQIISPSTNKNIDEHWCETCDRGFPSADTLNRHKQQHQKCNVDGCNFVAHPKVITKHIQMQHSSGLYKKICKLNNPEEIQKWREERKKKYPTRINIEKKAAEYKEKVERGEKMALKQVRGRNNRFTSDSQKTDKLTNRKRTRNFEKNNKSYGTNNMSKVNQPQNHAQPAIKKVPKMIPNVPTIIEKNKLRPFTGILHMAMHGDDRDVVDGSDTSNNLIEDDDYEAPMKLKKYTEEPVFCGALASLMGCYESSEDELNEEENKVINIFKTEKFSDTLDCETGKTHLENVNIRNIKKGMNTVHTVELKDNNENSDDDSGPEEIKSIKCEAESCQEEQGVKIKKTTPAKQLFQHKNGQRQNNNYRHKIPSTLLQKLLHKEIRHERNIVLQCIRHIKMMDYFDNTIK